LVRTCVRDDDVQTTGYPLDLADRSDVVGFLTRGELDGVNSAGVCLGKLLQFVCGVNVTGAGEDDGVRSGSQLADQSEACEIV
jgi:hypothetical protein